MIGDWSFLYKRYAETKSKRDVGNISTHTNSQASLRRANRPVAWLRTDRRYEKSSQVHRLLLQKKNVAHVSAVLLLFHADTRTHRTARAAPVATSLAAAMTRGGGEGPATRGNEMRNEGV